MADSDTLRTFLGSLFAEHGGAISFERFMSEALYHPRFGYYTAHITNVGGSRGDFATSPTLSKILGNAIAVWARFEATAHQRNLSEFTLVEVGAGNGSLMRDVS